MTMIAAKALHRKWMKNPAYKAEYEALSEEFALIGAPTEALESPRRSARTTRRPSA